MIVISQSTMNFLSEQIPLMASPYMVKELALPPSVRGWGLKQIMQKPNRGPLCTRQVPQIVTISLTDGLNARLIVLKDQKFNRTA